MHMSKSKKEQHNKYDPMFKIKIGHHLISSEDDINE